MSSRAAALLLPLLLLLAAARTGSASAGSTASAAADYELQSSDGHAPALPAGIMSTVLHGAGEQPGGPPSGATPSPNAYMALMTNAAPHFRAFGPLGGR